jgi:diamine N-acetyltransferase
MDLEKRLDKLLAGFEINDDRHIGICGGDTDMKIKLEPINDTNRKAVLALTVREDQPFVAQNDYSLSEADEANASAPGTARPFAIYVGEKIVGFCMLALDPEDENPVDRYCLWRLMIDKNEQGKGYGQAALHEVIKYFKENGVDTIYLSTAPENEVGLHVYHKAGFRETGEIEDGEAILVLKL